MWLCPIPVAGPEVVEAVAAAAANPRSPVVRGLRPLQVAGSVYADSWMSLPLGRQTIGPLMQKESDALVLKQVVIGKMVRRSEQ